MKKIIKSVKSFRKDLGSDPSGANDININEYITNYSEYDQNNNIIADITYNADGIIEQKYEYIYNNLGKLVEQILFYENNDIADRKKYEYDDKGNIIKEIVFYNDGSFDSINYSYDEDMNLFEKTTVSSDGLIEEKELFEYSHGKLILNALFDSEKNKFYETTYKYNNLGKLIELTEWESETNKNNRTLNYYDDNGYLIKQLRYSNDVLIGKMIFTLDSNNRVKEVIDEDVNRINNIRIVHDEMGNVIEETEMNFNNQINHNILRTYNDNNDVIESKVFLNTHNGGLIQNYIIRYEYIYY